MRCVIWGVGKQFEYVWNSLSKECEVKYAVDEDIKKQGRVLAGGIEIISPNSLNDISYDIIVVSIVNYESAFQRIESLNISQEKVIYFWKDSNHTRDGISIFDNRIKKILEERKWREIYEARLDSILYEYGVKSSPKIRSASELLELIYKNNSSLCRYGDGEFEIILGRERAKFQNADSSLAYRMKDILHNRREDICIGVAQNFVGLDIYNEQAADSIREYMKGHIRTEIIELLGNGVYYDAYVSRPYIIYRNDENAKQIFPMWKRIWDKRKVIIVEGKNGRTGIDNDLFSNASSVRRVVCPSTNAWNYYSLIIESICNIVNEDDLVCISLGPTATVLAYDLATRGIQSLDIGQLDNEYDWYKMKAKKRVPICGKYVAELSEKQEITGSSFYQSQVVCRIGE